EPDIALPSAINMEEVGESALDAALPWDRIQAAGFRRVNMPAKVPSALDLQKAEAARASEDPDFRWLVESIEAAEQMRDQTSLSLNLVERKAEREKQDAARLARENARRKANGLPVFATLEEMEKNASNEDEKVPDVLLERTTQIVG